VVGLDGVPGGNGAVPARVEVRWAARRTEGSQKAAHRTTPRFRMNRTAYI
jgi:hypothetical protein